MVLEKDGAVILVRLLTCLREFQLGFFAIMGTDLFIPFRLYTPEKYQKNPIQALLMNAVAPWRDRPLVRARNR
jgi:hypothetical protein